MNVSSWRQTFLCGEILTPLRVEKKQGASVDFLLRCKHANIYHNCSKGFSHVTKGTGFAKNREEVQ